jgi:hypothetical protein
MSITYCGCSSAGPGVGVDAGASRVTAASVGAFVAEGMAVSMESMGGLVGTGEEQEIRNRKRKEERIYLVIVVFCMASILTDIR